MNIPLILVISINFLLGSFANQESNVHRFLRPDEISVSNKFRNIPISMSRKFSGVAHRPSSSGLMPFISVLPPMIQLPVDQQNTHVESSFSLEASIPVLANENEVPEASTINSRSTTQGVKKYGLDEQEQSEVINSARFHKKFSLKTNSAEVRVKEFFNMRKQSLDGYFDIFNFLD
jgi:hypothetical protein